MKKRIATGILLFFTTTMLLGSVCSAEEASTVDFNEATVQSLIKKADSEFVYNDKGGDGTLTINKAYKKGSQYPVRKGVILVTPDKYKGLIPTGHAAIVYKVNKVVESLSKGVVLGNNNWNKSKKKCYGVTVKSTTGAQDIQATNWCYKQLGKPYNYNYVNVKTRKKFYCSQLVWAAFLDKYKINLNTSAFGAAVHPLELVTTEKTRTVYEHSNK